MSPSERDRSPEVPEAELTEEERESGQEPDGEQTSRAQPATPARIPIDAPEADALDQAIDVPAEADARDPG